MRGSRFPVAQPSRPTQPPRSSDTAPPFLMERTPPSEPRAWPLSTPDRDRFSLPWLPGHDGEPRVGRRVGPVEERPAPWSRPDAPEWRLAPGVVGPPEAVERSRDTR